MQSCTIYYSDRERDREGKKERERKRKKEEEKERKSRKQRKTDKYKKRKKKKRKEKEKGVAWSDMMENRFISYGIFAVMTGKFSIKSLCVCATDGGN